MNGGTSIASAIQKAGQLLKTVDRAAPHTAAADGAEGADDDDASAAAVEAEEAGPGHDGEDVGAEPAEVAAQS